MSTAVPASDYEYQRYRHFWLGILPVSQFAGESEQVLFQDGGVSIVLLTKKRLREIRWNETWRFTNNTTETINHEVEKTTSTRILTGEEYVEEFNVTAGFAKWGFSFDIGGSRQRKTFSEKETIHSETKKDTVPVPAGKTVRLYQKEYEFVCTTYFKGVSASKQAILGVTDAGPFAWPTELVVQSEEFVATNDEITGDGEFDIADPGYETPSEPIADFRGLPPRHMLFVMLYIDSLSLSISISSEQQKRVASQKASPSYKKEIAPIVSKLRAKTDITEEEGEKLRAFFSVEAF